MSGQKVEILLCHFDSPILTKQSKITPKGVFKSFNTCIIKTPE